MRVPLESTFSICSRDILRLSLCETMVQEVQRLQRDAVSQDFADIDYLQVLEMHQALLLLSPSADEQKAKCLSLLGDICSKQRTSEDIDGLERAIHLYRDALQVAEESYCAEKKHYIDLWWCAHKLFELNDDVPTLDTAVQAAEKVLMLTHNDDANYLVALDAFATSLRDRFAYTGDLEDIQKAIEIAQEALSLTPDEHPQQAQRLSTVSNSLLYRFARLGNAADIDEAVTTGQQAVALTAANGHPDHARLLTRLVKPLLWRFTQRGDIRDINNAIENVEKAVLLTPNEHPALLSRLSTLADALIFRFLRFGNVLDINKAIEVAEKTVLFTPEEHPEFASRLDVLGASLTGRFYRFGDVSDINKAIEVTERAVRLTPDGYLEHASRLTTLAQSFGHRFTRLGDVSDINKAIESAERAIRLTPEKHSEHALRLSVLADWLSKRFMQLGNLSDIDRAIELEEKAIFHSRDGHPEHAFWLNTLATALFRRFRQLRDPSDINKAIEIGEKALLVIPNGHQYRLQILLTQGRSLSCRFQEYRDPNDLNRSTLHFSLAAESTTGDMESKFAAAYTWQDLAMQHAAKDMITPSTVALNLIPELLWIALSIQDRQCVLAEVGVVVRNAVAAAIEETKHDLAIAWLEQGRSVLWNQILQLRTPLDELRQQHPAIADELQHVSNQLEASNSRGILSSSSNTPPEADYHGLATRREELLKEIRQVPGFHRFLLPKQSSEIISITKELAGPVVMLNVSQVQCAALILIPGSDETLHVPLTKMCLDDAVKWENHLESLIFYGAFTVGETDNRLVADSPQPPFCSTRSFDLRSFFRELDQPLNANRLKGVRIPDHGKRLGREEGLTYILERLWTSIVKPVLDALSTKNLTNIQRIWWCPTGPLAFLPIHAAGIYPDGPKLSDMVISSIIPSLGILEKASTPLTGKPQLLTVALPTEARLPATRDEVRGIAQHGKGINVIELFELNATKERVLDAIKHSQWVHFACHGKQNLGKSAESFLQLANSKLTLTEIIGLNLPNAELAFLSACETATGDKQLEEESVHLAAGMLLAGYRGVIATMWSIDDTIASEIAIETYRLLFNQFNADYRRAADALHFAVKNIRKYKEDKGEKVPLFNLVPFVHLGV